MTQSRISASDSSPEMIKLFDMLREQFDDLKSDLGARIDRLQSSFDEQKKEQSKRSDDHEDRIKNLEDPRISQVQVKKVAKENHWEVIYKWSMRFVIAFFFTWEAWREGFFTTLKHLFNNN